MQRTLSIIKPDAVVAGHMGEIISTFERDGIRIAAAKMLHLTQKQAEGFYDIHRERPFFGELTAFMTEWPILVMVLEGDNVIARNRELMGATNPEEAAAGTIRKRFATNIQNNAVHGSDSPETAAFEIAYFFNALELP